MSDDDLTGFSPAEGDPPSPAFVDALLGRLDEAWQSLADGHDTDPLPTSIDLTVPEDKDGPMVSNLFSGGSDRRATWIRAGLVVAAAAILVVVALVVTSDDDDGVVVGDLPDVGAGDDGGGVEESDAPVAASTATPAPTATQAPTATPVPTPTSTPTPTATPTPPAQAAWDFDITYIDVEAAGSVAANEDFAWVAAWSEPVLSKIELETNTVVSRVPLPSLGLTSNYGFGSVWVTHGDGTVSRVDPETDEVVATVTVGAGGLGWIGPGIDTMWVAARQDQQAVSIDPATNTVVAAIDIEGGCCGAIKEASHGVWIHGGVNGLLHRIDAATASVVASIDVGGAGAMMAGPDAVWVPTGSTVHRIDPGTNTISASIDLQAGVGRLVTAGGIHFGGGTVWVRYHHDDGTGVLRIDPATNEVVAHQELRDGWESTGGMNVGPTTAWTFNRNAIARIDFGD